MRKNNKRALILSCLSLLLCVSMLIGSTFAWFTDEAKTNVNKIESGTLKVDLQNANGKSLKGETLSFKKAGENVLWEPGCTWTLEDVYVVNNGNLALEYEIEISGINGNAKLNEVIEWTITGIEDGVLMPETKSGAISISGHMKEEANNDYQGLTIEGIAITVKAFQTPYEHDSFNNTYDENAHEAEEVKEATVATAAQLKTMLTQFTDAGSGDATINIAEDITLKEGEIWTPVKIDGYNGAGVITINGNGHTISGLNDTLLAGGFAGNSGIIVNDLTIANATINSSNTQGYGAFINCVDSMPKIELNNCHLKDSTITDTLGARVGGLIGWSAGYNNPNDGPVDTYITVKNCSVTDCEITAAGSVGAIIGHAGNNPATYHTITNCTVKNNTLTSTDDGGWRVGVVVGTANVGEVTISGTVSESNTLTQTGKTAPEGQSNLYGRFVPNDTGKLTIDGTAIN